MMNRREDFAAAAASYDNAAVLAREVGVRMVARLDCVKLAPRRFADIGCATGDGVRELMRRYPDALPLAVDSALPMLAAVQTRAGWWERLRGRAPRCINADVRALPLAAHSLDLVWSNLMLHWLPDPRLAFAELQRVLVDGGLLHFAMLGPDTLKELRAAAVKADAVLPAPTFIDMHDIGDMLMAAGFGDPVMEMEMLTLTYRTPRSFLADQRRLGVRDGLLGQLPWRQWRRVFAAWERAKGENEGLLPARFEIVYGHAWKLAPRTTLDGRAIVHFDRMKTRA
ncbi:MAG: methyltransferase domain-containing protein [Rhodocyclaceae bacterium]|nr:methyltransferase domain-containing protein [Rhodocyclaceae bacterium]